VTAVTADVATSPVSPDPLRPTALAGDTAARATRSRRVGEPRPRLWWVFPALAALLLLRNRYLFSRAIYEEGDAAANSILVDNAKHFSQLVGNYSRIGFHHPGPAFLYVHALGEWLLYDVLGAVPTPWNGQAVAVLLLNAALLALAITIICRWLAPGRAPNWVTAAVAGTALVYLGSNVDMGTSTWPPFEYFAPYVLLLAAGASVAAGAIRDLWALALAAGLLVHGHAEFLFLATTLAAIAVAAPLWRHRREMPGFLRAHRWHLVAALVVSALALLPIVVDLVRHWPGEFGKYLTYGQGHPVHPPWSAAYYLIRVWDPNPYLGAPLLVGGFTAALLAVRISRHPYVRWGLVFATVAVATFLVYASVGIDELTEPYIGFFLRGVPVFLLFLTVAATIRFLPVDSRGVAALFAAAGAVLGLISPAMINRQVTLSDVPGALSTLSARAMPGQLVTVRLAPDAAWAEALPLALSAHRRGMRICFVDVFVELMATPDYMCRPDERAAGLSVTVARKGAEPTGVEPLAPLNRSRIWLTPNR
jgi:hypothetical protein